VNVLKHIIQYQHQARSDLEGTIMTIPASLTRHDNSGSAPTWESLKRAIATSSGFKRWQQQTNPSESTEQMAPEHSSPEQSDQLVIDYLRETLDTLAY
jgi:hypothetical protein